MERERNKTQMSPHMSLLFQILNTQGTAVLREVTNNQNVISVQENERRH